MMHRPGAVVDTHLGVDPLHVAATQRVTDLQGPHDDAITIAELSRGHTAALVRYVSAARGDPLVQTAGGHTAVVLAGVQRIALCADSY